MTFYDIFSTVLELVTKIEPQYLINSRVKGHLEPTRLKSLPLFTFSTKWLGQDTPSVYLFSIKNGSRFTAAKIKFGEDSLS